MTVEYRREPSGNTGIPLFEMVKSYSSRHKNPGTEHCQMGSLTGEVASKRVTEAYKGTLSTDGNRALSYKGIKVLDCETYKSSRVERRS